MMRHRKIMKFRESSSRSREAKRDLARFKEALKRRLVPGTKVKLSVGLSQNRKSYIVKKLTNDGYCLLDGYYRLNSAKMLKHIKVSASNLIKE